MENDNMGKLPQNMLTGFCTADAAQRVAAHMNNPDVGVFASYYNADNETPGEYTRWGGLGHCVRVDVENYGQ